MTKFITLKDYRAHLPTIWKDARANNTTYIVTVHAKPVFEVRPITDQTFEGETLFVSEEEIKSYQKGMKEYRENKTVDADTFFNELKI